MYIFLRYSLDIKVRILKQKRNTGIGVPTTGNMIFTKDKFFATVLLGIIYILLAISFPDAIEIFFKVNKYPLIVGILISVVMLVLKHNRKMESIVKRSQITKTLLGHIFTSSILTQSGFIFLLIIDRFYLDSFIIKEGARSLNMNINFLFYGGLLILSLILFVHYKASV